MSARRRHTGRLKIPFANLEHAAATALADDAFVSAFREDWRLTRHSALYRRKDGSYTLCLVWHGSEGTTLTRTIRNIRLEEA